MWPRRSAACGTNCKPPAARYQDPCARLGIPRWRRWRRCRRRRHGCRRRSAVRRRAALRATASTYGLRHMSAPHPNRTGGLPRVRESSAPQSETGRIRSRSRFCRKSRNRTRSGTVVRSKSTASSARPTAAGTTRHRQYGSSTAECRSECRMSRRTGSRRCLPTA